MTRRAGALAGPALRALRRSSRRSPTTSTSARAAAATSWSSTTSTRVRARWSRASAGAERRPHHLALPAAAAGGRRGSRARRSAGRRWSPAPRLARALGPARRCCVKDDGRNPSASFKDRASAVALQRAPRARARRSSPAPRPATPPRPPRCWRRRVGIRTRIFVPKTAPRAKIAQLLTFGAEVLAVEGTYDQAFDLCLEATRQFGWYNRNTGFNPYTREGKKTVSFEICEQLGWQVPDLVVVPVGDGNIISGRLEGLRRVPARSGFIDRAAAAARGAGRGQRGHRQRRGRRRRHPAGLGRHRGRLHLGEPAARRRGGGAGDPRLGRLRRHRQRRRRSSPPSREVARGAGVFAEPAAAAAWAGLKEAVRRGLVDPSWRVVVLITGNGLKDVASAMKVAGEPRVIPPDPAVLDTLFPRDRDEPSPQPASRRAADHPRSRREPMRSFAGRDILSLKDFERDEYYRIFEVCDELAPHRAQPPQHRPCADKTLRDARSTSPARAPAWPPRPPCTAWAATCSASPTPR